MTQRVGVWLQVVMWVCLIGGLHMFLNSEHSTGEALERFSLSVSLSAISIIGGMLMALAISMLLFLHFSR